MRNVLIGLATAAWVCAAPGVASAHHSHMRFYDWCRSLTIEGRITRVEWKNPHSLIDVETDGGTTYHVEWMGVPNLARMYNGAPPAALAFGVRVVVIAHPMRDAAAIRAYFPEWTGTTTPNLVDPSQIRRVDNTFSWPAAPAATPQTPSDCGGK
jgi:hypothetical protein